MVPWLSITENPRLYFANQYFPATTPFKEPTKLTYAQVMDILHFWRRRQQDTPHDIFKFQKWKDFNGILCDPVTEEPMANKSGKGKPGWSVGSWSAKGKRLAREIPGKTIMWWSTYHWHPLKRLVMMRSQHRWWHLRIWHANISEPSGAEGSNFVEENTIPMWAWNGR